MQRKLDASFWHPEQVLAVQQAVAKCPQYQLMKRPDIILLNLVPIKPLLSLTRWAIDHTFWKGSPILVMVEYAIGWVEASFVSSKRWKHMLLMLTSVQNRFGSPHELISDNAGEFSSDIAKKWHQQYGTSVHPTTPSRPRGNKKVEQINGHLKAIITKVHLIHPEIPFPDLLQNAINLHNRTTRPNGYFPYFLLYGIIPPERTNPEAYTRKSTWEKKETHERELAQYHEAKMARTQANGLKALRNQIKAYLQKKKALLRVYAPGDWMLRVRQRNHKLEPFYNGPWAILSCHSNNTYILRSPGGVTLANRYNGTNLFPAYVPNGYPVRSLWYASKQALQKNRARLSSAIRNTAD
jgi:hypothetical protein